MKPVRIGAEAEAELEAAADWYEAQRPGLKADFLFVIRSALEAISHSPASGPSTRTRGRTVVRRTVVPRFPFAIVYVDDDDRVVVIAVEHTSRRPGYWIDRVEKRH